MRVHGRTRKEQPNRTFVCSGYHNFLWVGSQVLSISYARRPPEYLSLTDTSQRLSKLCKRQFIFKQSLSEIRRIFTQIHHPLPPPLVQPQLYTRPSNPPLHKTSKNVLSFITKLSHLTPTLSDISKEPKGDDTNERVRSEYTRREHAE